MDFLSNIGTLGPGYSNGAIASNINNDPTYQDIHDSYHPNSVVRDSTQDAINKLAKDLDIKLSPDTKDYLYQYYLQRKNDEWAYQKQTEYDSSRYQRTVADLKAAGLNPFLALQSLSPASGNVNSGSITSGSITSRANAQVQSKTDTARSILSVLGMIAGAVIMSMA